MFAAVESLVLTGLDLGAVQSPVELFEDDIVDQRAFAGARNSGDTGEKPQRDPGFDLFEVVLARPLDFEPFAVGLAPR